ncbi:latrophilin Cirl-like isoform X2 [Tachypleus tridentatus]|uniref:latrophilin Cirl-like isoform X2 n=1 Tax=Tachypleus tridentatus TaxID=6853 RepID=UPI003FD34713
MKDIKTHAKKVLIVLWRFLMVVATERRDHRHYLTAYACEGSYMNISCETGQLIHLIRANYGRFSITICNEEGSLDWSVNCGSLSSSYQTIKENCGMREACVVPASSAIFGDPCPQTRKYLEAHYQCVADSTLVSPTTTALSTTTKTATEHRPPIILPVTQNFQPLVISSTTETVLFFETARLFPLSPSLSTTASSHVKKQELSPSVEYSESTSGSINTYSNKDSKTMYSHSSSTDILEQTLTSCPPTVFRNITWGWTRRGQEATEPCPRGSVGLAKWYCVDAITSVRWSGAPPDLSECRSPWTESLMNRIDGGDSVVGIATELAVIARTKPLYGGDIPETSTILHRIVSKMEDRSQDITDEKQRYYLVLDMLHSVMEIVSGLMENFQQQAWLDMSSSQQRVVASTLIQRLEETTWVFAHTNYFGERWVHVENNILVSIRLVQTWSITTLQFPLSEEVEGTSWEPISDVILLPATALVGSGRNGRVKIVFIAYRNIQNFTPLEGNLPVSNRSDDAHVSTTVNTTRLINSRVLSASIDHHRTIRLHQPVTVILKHLQEENVTNPQCVYWDLRESRWSSEGCWVKETNTTHTECSCNNLRNFALIMDISTNKVELDDQLTIQIVTSIGCGVAIFFLSATFIILLVVRCLKDDRQLIHNNMCFCLIVSEVIFVGGIDFVMNRIICGLVAGLLHYFFLSTFIWMFLGPLQLLLVSLERKGYSDSTRRRWVWYCCSGYGLPIIAVGVCAFIEPQGYGTMFYCWLKLNNYFILGFLGPALVFVLVSFIILCVISVSFCRKNGESLTSENKEQPKLINLRSRCRQSACILILLCLTWGSAQWFLLWKTSLTGYIFAVLNSLQGVVIFVEFCLRSSKLTQGSWKSSKSQQREKQVKILDSPDLPFIPMVGLRVHEHVTEFGSKFYGENNNSFSTPSTRKKYLERDRGSKRFLSEATSGGICSYTPNIYYAKLDHKYQITDGESTVDVCRCKPRATSECNNDFDCFKPVTISYSPGNTCERQPMKQHDLRPENTTKSTLPASSRPRHLPLFRDGYIRPRVSYNGINSPTDSERSFNSLVNDRDVISLSSSPSSQHDSNTSSMSHELRPESERLQSLPNFKTSERSKSSAFSNVFKFQSDSTTLSSNLKN